MADEPRTTRWHFARLVVASVAIAVAIAALFDAREVVRLRVAGVHTSWSALFRWDLAYWIAWGVLAPFVVQTLRRCIARGTRSLVLGAYTIALGLVIQFGMPIVVLGALHAMHMATRPWWEAYRTTLVLQGVFNVLIYSLLAGAAYAVAFVERSREQRLEAMMLAEQLTRSRLDALRAQLNPHFLFNTLNSVAMLVRAGDARSAVRVLARLSDLLRTALDESRPSLVTLRDELAFARQYLAIEEERFRNRLAVRVQVDGAAEDALLPSFILQPVVENAIRHGIARRRAAREVAIAARVDGAHLVVTGRDDGPGLAVESRTTAPTGGIGLRNTRERLATIYGDAASLALENDASGGAVSTIRVPLELA